LRSSAAYTAPGTGVREEDRVLVIEEQFGVTDHARAVVVQAVEQNDGGGIGMIRHEEPGTKCDVVRGF
jgi:hypothetical protein